MAGEKEIPLYAMYATGVTNPGQETMGGQIWWMSVWC